MSNTSQFFHKIIQHYCIKSIGFDNELTKIYKVKKFFWGWKIEASLTLCLKILIELTFWFVMMLALLLFKVENLYN
jgi:hypothetical protein